MIRRIPELSPEAAEYLRDLRTLSEEDFRAKHALRDDRRHRLHERRTEEADARSVIQR
jgi:hypothetical protein